MIECPQCGDQNVPDNRFCSACGGALEPQLDEGRASRSTPVAIGTVFEGKYEVREEIGRGGMGVVYKGHDVSLDRMVAIKVLPEQFNTEDEVIARFKKEARAMAALDHPNIVPVYAIGQQKHFHYFVMKYLDGETIAEILERTEAEHFRFPLEVVRSIAVQMCRGLGHAHRRGLIHRDIKPGNIMLDPEGHVTIMDFGIVKEEKSSENLTRTGLVFGTPEYMAPEQAQGQLGPGPSTDIYSVGIVAYEMLSGRPPFRGETPFSVVLKHIKNPPEPLITHLPDVSAAFQQAIFKALEKKPKDRYQTADEMRLALEEAANQSLAAPLRPEPTLPPPSQLPVSLPPPPGTPVPHAITMEPPAPSTTVPPGGAQFGQASSAPRMAPAPLTARPTPATVAGPRPILGENDSVVLEDRPGHYRQFLDRPSISVGPPLESTPNMKRVQVNQRAPSGRPTASRKPQQSQQASKVHPSAGRSRHAQPPASGRSTLAIALAIVGLVGLALLAYAMTRPQGLHSEQIVEDPVLDAAKMVEATPHTVQIHLLTTPTGALVYAVGQDKQPLGDTPYLAIETMSSSMVRYVLKKPGYHDKEVQISLAKDQRVALKLDKLK